MEFTDLGRFRVLEFTGLGIGILEFRVLEFMGLGRFRVLEFTGLGSWVLEFGVRGI